MRRRDSASYGKLPSRSRCTRCRKRAVVHLPSHNANFCDSCFVFFFKNAVKRALKLFPVKRDTPIMVAVSGGKDSLAAWLVLEELGFKTLGVHIDLGIPEFSQASRRAVESFAKSRALGYRVYSIVDLLGYSLPEIYKRTNRMVCAVCGTVKRQLLNRIAFQEGFRVVATGHNLDDEASRLLGNIVRHREQYLEKSYPYLPSIGKKIPARIKPLFRVEADEIRIYCQIKGINYFSGTCPFSRGATSHIFFEALSFLEAEMPGTKRDFLFHFVRNHTPPETDINYKTCSKCGYPSYSDLCSLCSLKERLGNQGD